jgi:iron complex transport system permease protein
LSRGRRLGILAALGALLVAALLLGVRVGSVPISTGELLAALRGEGDATTLTIVRQLRVPRVLLAALVGAGLAVAGATFQALLRNPLAEPYILGISGGAALGAVLALVLGLAAASPAALPLAALGGALLAMFLVVRIAAVAGGILDTRVLLLAGVVVGSFFGACILLALTFADPDAFRSAIFWMMGSLSAASWTSVGLLALYLAPALAILLALARPLDLLALGEEPAAHLGVRVERTKWLAYGTASLATAAGVAVSGVIGFVGLVVPHVVRIAWRGDHRFLLPASALLGGAFLVAADALARTAAAPRELPIGAITAFVGVPFFVWLLRRRGA